MFSFFNDDQTTQMPDNRTFAEAVERYKSRHNCSDSDIDILKKEGGDLDNLYLLGVDPLDLEDALIIAQKNPDRPLSPREPSEEQKGPVIDRAPPTVLPVQPPTDQRSFSPSLFIPTFGVFDAPTNPIAPTSVASMQPPVVSVPSAAAPESAQTPPPPSLYIPTFGVFDTAPVPAAPITNATAPTLAPEPAQIPVPPSLYIPTFGVFDTAPVPAAPTADVAAAPAPSQSLFPFVFDLSPRTSTLPTADPLSAPASVTAPTVPPLESFLPSLIPTSMTGGEAAVPADPLAKAADNSPMKYSPYIYFTVFDDLDNGNDTDANAAEPASDSVEMYKLRALRDQEELKALKSLLSESGQRPNDEIDFFRKQLADIETVHSKCFDVRRQLGAAELQLAKVQSELKEKTDEVIRLKCDDAAVRQQVADCNTSAALAAVEIQAQKEENKRLRLQMEDASRHSAAYARQGWDEAERRQQQLADLERRLVDAQAQNKPAPASPNASLLLQLERTAARAALLEDQNRSAQKGMDDLFRQLTDVSRQKVALEGQARSDQETIAALRSQLRGTREPPVASTAADNKRLADLSEVNSTLLALTKNGQFQQDLARPLVKIALTAWSGANVSHISEAQLESARLDDGVGRVYPRLKAFEAVCDAAKIRFPVDHIQQSKTELSRQAVLEAFGPDFVALHLLNA